MLDAGLAADEKPFRSTLHVQELTSFALPSHAFEEVHRHGKFFRATHFVLRKLFEDQDFEPLSWTVVSIFSFRFLLCLSNTSKTQIVRHIFNQTRLKDGPNGIGARYAMTGLGGIRWGGEKKGYSVNFIIISPLCLYIFRQQFIYFHFFFVL